MRTALLLMALSWLASSLQGQQQCKCQVTNIGSTSVPSGTCNEYEGGPPVPCFSASITSVPGQGLPQSGKCQNVNVAPCEATEVGCTYSTRRFVVTAAPCSASCGMVHAVSLIAIGGTASSLPTISPGQTVNYDAPATGINSVCNTAEQSVFIRFFDPDLALLFECRARYGCANCSANRGT